MAKPVQRKKPKEPAQPPTVELSELTEPLLSVLFGLTGKPLNLAHALCQLAIDRRNDTSLNEVDRYLASTIPALTRAKQAAKACRLRLEKMRRNFPDPPVVGAINPAAMAVADTISALLNLEQLDLGSTTKQFRKACKAWTRANWNVSDRAVAWSLNYILLGYSEPKLTQRDTLERMRRFWGECLHTNIEADSIRRKISLFSSGQRCKAQEHWLLRFLA